MTLEHRGLAEGRWAQMSFVEQMANIGSEVERALNWRSRNNGEYARKASERALELFDLSLAATQDASRLRELARAREAWAEYFFGKNPFCSNDEEWKKYFFQFTYAARKNH